MCQRVLQDRNYPCLLLLLQGYGLSVRRGLARYRLIIGLNMCYTPPGQCCKVPAALLEGEICVAVLQMPNGCGLPG